MQKSSDKKYESTKTPNRHVDTDLIRKRLLRQNNSECFSLKYIHRKRLLKSSCCIVKITPKTHSIKA